MTLAIRHTFDDNSFRHFVNGHGFVLHCHHYMSLTTRVAETFADIGGPRVLREAAEDSLRPVFDSYFREHAVSGGEARLAIGGEYYSFMGLGQLVATGSAAGGEVRVPRSHVDAGWQMKWGAHDKPINHFTCGFVEALFAAAFEKPARAYEVIERASIAMGAPESLFTVKAA